MVTFPKTFGRICPDHVGTSEVALASPYEDPPPDCPKMLIQVIELWVNALDRKAPESCASWEGPRLVAIGVLGGEHSGGRETHQASKQASTEERRVGLKK